jgi:hypothetical protein
MSAAWPAALANRLIMQAKFACELTPDPKVCAVRPMHMISSGDMQLWGKAALYTEVKSRMIMCEYKERTLRGATSLFTMKVWRFASASHGFKIDQKETVCEGQSSYRLE